MRVVLKREEKEESVVELLMFAEDEDEKEFCFGRW